MDTPTSSRPQSTPLGIIIAMSMIFGLLGGGFGAYLILSTTEGGTIVNSVAGTKTVKVEEESATTDVVAKASPAVVSIVATKDLSKVYQQSPFGWLFGNGNQQSGRQQVSSGTGFIVRADGLIVTNKHVVDDETAEYSVLTNDGKSYVAKVVAKDPVNDVAVIDIDATDLPTLKLGDSSSVKIGQTVIAIGNALGQYQNSVTKGVISGKARTITAGDSSGQSETLEDVFQTDASINSGNSGGPLIDLDGNVIGVNTAVDQQGQLIGFALPIDVIKKDLASIDKTGKIVQPYMGIRYVIITEALAKQNDLPVTEGALVQRGTTSGELAVIPGSPADKAGIVENDIIVSVNGTKITPARQLVGILSKFSPGDQVTIELYHQGNKKEVKVTLEERTD